jgi:calcium-binding protein CML
VRLGVRLDPREFAAFQQDCDADGDGQITLAEFSAAVEARSVQTATEERDGWARVLDKLLVTKADGKSGAALQALSPDKRLEAAFAAADADGNGELDIGELTVVLKALGVNMSVVQNALVRDAMDANGDGTISLSEFRAVFAAQKNSARDMAWAVFLNFMHRHPETSDSVASVFLAADADGNGELDVGELATVLVGLGIELDALQLRLFRDDIDANGDGAISLAEFQSAIEAKARALGFELPPPASGPSGGRETF